MYLELHSIFAGPEKAFGYISFMDIKSAFIKVIKKLILQ